MNYLLLLVESLLFGLMVYGVQGYFGSIAVTVNKFDRDAINTLNNKSVTLSFIVTLFYLISQLREM